MANLTLTISDSVLRRARIRALEESTSVNAVVREFLDRYAGEDVGIAALQRFLGAARESDASSGPAGRAWTRDDLYEQRLRREHG